jgi:sensor histidine kinase YesM
MGVGLENLAQRLQRFAGPDASLRSGTRDDGGYEVELRWRSGRTTP